MARRNLPVILLALLLVVPFAACGTAEEPGEPPAPESPEPAAPEVPVEQPAATETQEQAEQEQQQPELVGDIRLAGEDLIWGEPTPDTAPYEWTVRVTNDTTATLDITVRFQLLDDNDAVVKTERATVRLQPAQSRTLREAGSIAYREANRVSSYSATYEEYKIIEG